MEMVVSARTLCYVLEARGAFTSWSHTKAHCGHPWNAVADGLAKAAAQGAYATRPHLRLPRQWFAGTGMRHWAWLLAMTPAQLADSGYPPRVEGGLLCLLPDPGYTMGERLGFEAQAGAEVTASFELRVGISISSGAPPLARERSAPARAAGTAPAWCTAGTAWIWP